MFTVGRQPDSLTRPFSENDTPEVVLVTPSIDEAYLELRRQYRLLKGTHLVHISDANGEYTSLALEDERSSVEARDLEHAIELVSEKHSHFFVQRRYPGSYNFIRLSEENGTELLGRYTSHHDELPNKRVLVLDDDRVRIPDQGADEWIPKSRIATELANGDEEILGRFGHHPDADTDFSVEVEAIESYVTDARLGISRPGEPPRAIDAALGERIRDARAFVPSDSISRKAMATLIKIENEILASLINRYTKA